LISGRTTSRKEMKTRIMEEKPMLPMGPRQVIAEATKTRRKSQRKKCKSSIIKVARA